MFYQHHIQEGHEMDFDNVKILDRASNDLKLQYKEMLYIRKLNPSLNKQTNSELFTLIIRNIQQENSITRDFQNTSDPKLINQKRSLSLSEKYTNVLFNCLFGALYGYL